MSDDRSQENSVPEQATAQQEPDVLLDVENLEVDRISLEVDGLRAHVSLLAELANLLHLSVGADVRLDVVKLEIEGVEAQAVLKVRLEHVRAILEKALDTIAENPQILEILSRTAEEVGGAAQEAVGEGGAVSELGEGVGDATQRVGEAADQVTEEAQGAVGQVTGQARQAAQGATEEAQEGEVKVTPSAERLAQQLGVDLSRVSGTGAGGRITVRDVRSAAQGG